MSTFWNVISVNEPNAKMRFKMHRGEIKFIPMDYYFIYAISVNEPNAKMRFKMHRGEIKFIPMDYYFIYASEDEIVFSHAIAKFQNLVRFEE